MTNQEESSETPQNSLPRILGLFDATAMVIGSIIGSGIFLKVGNVDQALMSWGFLPIILVWVFVGLITLCGSLALAELAALYPHAGGPYLYLREAYGRVPAFLWGWTEFWVVRSGTVGALACATVIYLDEFLHYSSSDKSTLGHFGQMLLSIAIVIGLSVINIVSTRWGASVQNIATVSKLGFLSLLIVLPLVMGKINIQNLFPLIGDATATVTATTEASSTSIAQTEVDSQRSLLAVLGLALFAVFWPYDGWINIAPIAEEIRDPENNIPRALSLGIAVVILVYVGANLSYHLVLTMPAVATSERLAADVFRQLFGDWGSKFAALGVLCSTFGAANSNLIAGPRIYFAAARDGLVPNFIQKVHPVFNTPANSIGLQGIWTTFLTVVFFAISPHPKDVFDLITDAVICAGLMFYSMAVGAVYVLRNKHPDATRPYRTWGYPWTPGLLIATYAIALAVELIKHWDRIAWVLALIAVGMIYYLCAARVERQTSRCSVPPA